MSFASLRVFTYAYPVSFLSKCHAKNRKEVLAVRTSYRKEVLALLSCSRTEVLAVSRTRAQATCNQPQEELLLADAKRSSCACIIFGLYCIMVLKNINCCVKQCMYSSSNQKINLALAKVLLHNTRCNFRYQIGILIFNIIGKRKRTPKQCSLVI